MCFRIHHLTAIKNKYFLIFPSDSYHGNRRRGGKARDFSFTRIPCIITFLSPSKDSPMDSLVSFLLFLSFFCSLLLSVTNHLSIKTEKENLTSCHGFDLTKLSFFCLFRLSYFYGIFAFPFSKRGQVDQVGDEGACKVILLLIRILFNFGN